MCAYADGIFTAATSRKELNLKHSPTASKLKFITSADAIKVLRPSWPLGVGVILKQAQRVEIRRLTGRQRSRSSLF